MSITRLGGGEELNEGDRRDRKRKREREGVKGWGG